MPQPCSKYRGPTQRGVHYTYHYEGREYTSSRVVPFPFTSDSLENCGNDTGLGFTPHIRGKRPNVLRAAQPRFFFYSLCSEK